MIFIIKEIAAIVRQAALRYLLRAALLCAAVAAPALAQSEPIAATTPATAAVATQTLLRADAPDLYTVQPGDTLWGIAQRFLNEPWRWPELWDRNRDQIANPHRLFPGQTLLLDRQAQQLRLATPLYEKRFPTVRTTPLTAIPTLPLAAVHPFLTRPIVVTTQQLEGSGQIVAFDEGRTMAGLFDRAYATGIPPEATQVRLFRPGQPIVARDGKQILGYEARYLGDAQVVARDESEHGVLLTITRSLAEIRLGDRVVLPDPEPLTNFVPQLPDVDFAAQVLNLWNEQPESGPFEVILLDAGEEAGLKPGHVVALWRQAPPPKEKERAISLPPRRYGLAMVFRTFPSLSYALVLEATDSVRRGDQARTPGVSFVP